MKNVLKIYLLFWKRASDGWCYCVWWLPVPCGFCAHARSGELLDLAECGMCPCRVRRGEFGRGCLCGCHLVNRAMAVAWSLGRRVGL